jgi:hypothetical protein
MTDDQAGPAAGFQATETFSNTMPFIAAIRRFIPLAVMLLLVTWLILSSLLRMTGLPAVGSIGFMLAVLFVAAMVYAKKRQFDQSWGSSTLELSPSGATERVGPVRTHLAWEAVRGLGKHSLAPPWMAAPTRTDFAGSNVVSSLAVGVGSAVANKADQDALVGGGSLTIDRDASSVTRAQYDGNLAQRQIDPQTGSPVVAVLLTHYDSNWRVGRIGEWIRVYRPDLLA